MNRPVLEIADLVRAAGDGFIGTPSIAGTSTSLFFIPGSGSQENRYLFIAQGHHGIEAAGAEGGDIACSASHEGDSSGG
jgi:hypothetical protein